MTARRSTAVAGRDPRSACWLPVLGLVALAAGCDQGNVVAELRRENHRLEESLEQSESRLAAARSEIEGMRRQLDVARGFTEEDRRKLFTPTRIEILNLSGGENYDGSPGDDGVTVYLRPIDEAGDALKVAGDIRVELYDLAAPEGEKLIATCNYPVEEVSDHWYGKLMTYHYTLRCPWQERRPRNPELTVRATFLDYLTQRVITAQKVVSVELAGGS